ncbi:MAG: glyoxalase [Solirubrobacteraceae bacterium]|nr:glyoxalase [Solirubrobacteraceae bacterium]
MADSRVFVSIPTTSVSASRAFFTTLGFTFDEALSGESSVCLQLNEQTFFMLVERELFISFSYSGRTADIAGAPAAQFSYSVDSREAVDAAIETAVAAGGTEAGEAEDHGAMFTRSFLDLDGHLWAPTWVDPAPTSGEAPVEQGATA